MLELTTSTRIGARLDLAAEHPEKLAALKELFAIEAARQRRDAHGGGPLHVVLRVDGNDVGIGAGSGQRTAAVQRERASSTSGGRTVARCRGRTPIGCRSPSTGTSTPCTSDTRLPRSTPDRVTAHPAPRRRGSRRLLLGGLTESRLARATVG